jgi:ferritin-like protein
LQTKISRREDEMSYYEPSSELSSAARDFDRVIQSLIEELEAINLYNQRGDVAKDESVKALVIHNRNEEIEHACMLMEWLRRRTPEFDKELRTYLFTEAPITEVEAGASGAGADVSDSGSLGIGSLKK